MKRLCRTVEVSLLLWLALVPCCIVQAQDSQVVLLRNGTTLQGRVVREGDIYYVAVAGGEIQLRASQVERVCQSLEECYRYRLGHLLPGDVQGRLELAHWCLEQGLVEQAHKLLNEVARTHPRHPRLELLRRLLRLKKQSPRRSSPSAEPRSVSARSGSVYQQHQRQAEWDQAQLGELSPQVVRQFTISVHRILQNRCAAGGCHGPGARNGFRLIRASQGRVSPRVVRHNLVQVLQWIDRRHADRSVLLHKALTPHGKQGLSRFGGLDKHSARVLRRWVAQLQQPPAEEQQAQTATARSGQPSPAAKEAVPRTVNAHLFRRQQDLRQGNSTGPPKAPSAVSLPPAGAPAASMLPARYERPSLSASPYDPAWFNRRYHGHPSRDKEPASPTPAGATITTEKKATQPENNPARVLPSRKGRSVDKSKGGPSPRPD